MSRVAEWLERSAPLLAWAAAGVAIVVSVATAILVAAGASGEIPWKQIVIPALWALPAALMSAGRPRVAVGWLFLGVVLFFAGAGLAGQWVHYARAVGIDAGVAWAVWFVDRFSAFLVVLTVLALFLVPDGALPSPRWRPVVWAAVALQAVALSGWALVRGPAAAPDSEFPVDVLHHPNPVGVLPPATGVAIDNFEIVLLQIPLLLSVAAFGTRLWRAKGDERSRLAAILLAATIFVLLVVVGRVLWPSGALLLEVGGAALLALVMTIAVLQRWLPGFDVVVHHALVYTVLTVVITGLYVLTVNAVVRQGQELPTLASGLLVAVVALAALPLRSWLQRWADRQLYGDRREPYAALRRLSENTSDAVTLDAALSELASTVAGALRVPWVRTEAAGHTVVWGKRPRHGTEISAPLVSRGEQLGGVSVVAGPGRTLRDDDRRLLTDLARYGGLVVQSMQLAEAVQASRQRLVVAREEERRRLRRDLHEELGPTMASMTMQLGALRRTVRRDPATAAEQIGRLQGAAKRALEDIRTVARELRPPVIDELGLAAALRQLADGLGLSLQLDDGELPRLPAAVEVAAYRVGAEALSNVARHAGTEQVRLSLIVSGTDLVLQVADNGRGWDGGGTPGVGLLGMRERADELGGSLVVESAPGQGTAVTARWPIGDDVVAEVGS